MNEEHSKQIVAKLGQILTQLQFLGWLIAALLGAIIGCLLGLVSALASLHL